MSKDIRGALLLDTYCSNKCLFCDGREQASASEVKKQEIIVLKNIFEFKKKNKKIIEISGGDPVDYNKIIGLIKYLKGLDFKVQLSTHGNKLGDEIFCNELISTEVDQLRIPLYGSNEKIHDAVTRNPGSFRSVIKGIKKIKSETNIKVQISSLILENNKNNLIDLAELVNSLRVKDFYFSIPFIKRDDYSFYIPSKKLPPYVRKLYSHIAENKFNVRFMEIPYCIFGFKDERIDNFTPPPDVGDSQPFGEFKSEFRNIPTYRLKKKADFCTDCVCNKYCNGFLKKDILKFGLGDLAPVKK